MAFECEPGEVIEVDELLTYIEENAVPGPQGEEGPQGIPGPPGNIDGAYLINGSVDITAPFAGGGQQFKNASDAADKSDLTTLGQVEDKISIGVYNRQTRAMQNIR